MGSETENLLLASSSEEESPLKMSDLVKGRSAEEKFTFAQINTKPYWKSVLLLLFTDLGCDTLTPAHYHTFVNNFERKGGVECRLPDPSFDAWCLVTGTPRNVFDTYAFLKCYPSTASQLEVVRKRLDIIVKRKLL